jgi:hypothetical protein
MVNVSQVSSKEGGHPIYGAILHSFQFVFALEVFGGASDFFMAGNVSVKSFIIPLSMLKACSTSAGLMENTSFTSRRSLSLNCLTKRFR